MAAVIAHSERRKLVAGKTLKLFVRYGYDKVSFQDISKATGVPRTAIYRYFKTKREIFDAAIYAVIENLRAQIAEVRGEEKDAAGRLRDVCALVARRLHEERDFVYVIFNFVFSKVATGEDMAEKVTEFTKGLKVTFRDLVAEGVNDGSIRKDIDPNIMAELFFANIESAALKMLLGMEKDCNPAILRLSAGVDAITRV